MLRRRSLLVALSLSALAALGCSDKKGSEGSGSAASKDLNLFGWSEYVPDSVLEGFKKETGITVHYETFASNEEMLSKLLAGGTTYDLIQPSEYAVEALNKQNKLADLNAANIPNLKNIAADMRGLPHDPEYKRCVPYMAGSVGIVVNTDKVKDPVASYKDVFQAKYKGRIVVVNDAREMVTWALSTLNIGPNAVDAASLDKAKPILAEWTKLVKVFDSDSPKTAFLNGDVDIGIVWSGEAALLYQQDKKYAYVLPAEGNHFWVDHLCIPVGAKNKTGAEMFINYVLRPDVSQQISEKFPYTNPNAEARKLLTEAQRSNPASYPPKWFGPTPDGVLKGMDVAKRGETYRDIGKLATEIDKLVTDVKAQN